MKIKFTVNDKELAVVQPTQAQRSLGKIEYNKAVRKAIETGHLVRAKLDDYMKDQGLWTDENQKEDTEMCELIEGQIKRLREGNMTVKDGRKLAVEIRKNRNKLIRLRSTRNTLDNITAEAFGEQAQFEYLISVCTVYNDTGKPYFESIEDYKNKSVSDEAYEAAEKLTSLLYNLEDFEKSLPENKFLMKFKFVNDKMELVNDKGELVDADGQPYVEDVEKPDDSFDNFIEAETTDSLD